MELLQKIGAKQARLKKLMNDLLRFNGSYPILKDGSTGNNLTVKLDAKRYWQRVFSATMSVAQHIFDTPEGKHPLIYEIRSSDKSQHRRWITSGDLEYMTLVMIYSLVRLAWEKNVLVIGLIKDSAAAELIKTVVPILQNANKISSVKLRYQTIVMMTNK